MGYELTSALLPAGGKDGTLKESDCCILSFLFLYFPKHRYHRQHGEHNSEQCARYLNKGKTT